MSTLVQARHRLAAAKNRSQAIVRREDGGIDLPSTMVSILVIAAFLAAAALAVFVVIPWAQDNAAKQLVSQVATGQSTYYAMSADAGTDPKYASVKDMVDGSLLSGFAGGAPSSAGTAPKTTETSIDDKAKLKLIVTNATASNTDPTWKDTFVAKVRSDTGKVFVVSNDNPQPTVGTW